MKMNLDDLYISNVIDDDPDSIEIDLSDESDKSDHDKMANKLSILPLRNSVFFPKIVSPILMGRESSLKLIKKVYNGNKIIGVVAQKESKHENPLFADLYEYGTMARIAKTLEMPDGSKSIVIQGLSRFKINKIIKETPFLVAKVDLLDDEYPEDNDKEFGAIISNLRDITISIIELTPYLPDEAIVAVKNIEDPAFLINFVCSNIDFEVEKKQELLRINELKERAMLLLEYASYELKKLELKDDIGYKVHKDLDSEQRKYILKQHIKAIKSELGDDQNNQEIKDYKNRAKKKKWNKKVAKRFDKELEKLEHIHQSSPDYSIQLAYLQVILDLPWEKFTKDQLELPKAEKVLDKDHFGLDNVKERILEYLSILKLKGDLKSPIICLYGPPGVGKTSLGQSIAKALKRKYVRMSLGGLHDEAEIRGHRRTYIGAMPGRIIQNLKKAGSSNPVFVLDEIDKVGSNFKGDPASALLEVLDPEQNNNFHDNYLDLEYDLSNVMFVATANTLNTISSALLDRMELINVTGYIVEEKIQIAKKHLIPKQLKAHGVKRNQLKFSNKILEFIVEKYTRESGVRHLDKTIASLVRKTAKKIAFGAERKVNLEEKDIIEMLKSPKFTKSKYQGNKIAGIVTGLAWTSVGGEITTIESSISRGAGKLTLTGNLGNVMKESAIIALEYTKAHCRKFKIHSQIFNHWNVHVHVPEGAIPKDGPSAGITMATSLISLFTQRKVKPNIAMTGEITLTGTVLPVGGIKEKILAAKRAGINEIILSTENKNDIDEIKEIYRKGVKFHHVENILDVIDIALLNEKVENPTKIGIPKPKKVVSG